METKLIITLLLILILAGGAGVYFYGKDKELFAISIQDAADGSIVTELFGYLRCEPTGAKTNWVQGSALSSTNTYSSFQYTCNDPQSCEIKFDAICNNGNQDNLYYKINNQPYSIYDNDLIKARGVVLPFSKDESKQIYLTCVETQFLLTRLEKPDAGGYLFRKNEYGIYLYSEGYGRQGLIDSSLPDCSYISTDTGIKKLFEIQREGTSIPVIGSSLPLGRTQSFTVGWTQQPLIGNINPAGNYNGNDVLCKASTSGAELHKLNKVTTNSQKNYYIDSGIIASGVNYCCPSSVPCSSGFVCEGYKCVQQPVNCQLGQCNTWQRNQVIESNICVQENGRYYNYNKYCDQNACIQQQQKKEVKCCPSSCGYGKRCDINEGCVDVNILKQCPVQECCIEGGEWKIQSCQSGLTCCLGDVLGDDFRGLCKTSCTTPPDGEEEKKSDCLSKGGEWISQNTKDCTLFVFCKEVDTSYCKLPKFPVLSVVLMGLGMLLFFFGVMKKDEDYSIALYIFGLFLAISGMIWLILAQSGIL